MSVALSASWLPLSKIEQPPMPNSKPQSRGNDLRPPERMRTTDQLGCRNIFSGRKSPPIIFPMRKISVAPSLTPPLQAQVVASCCSEVRLEQCADTYRQCTPNEKVPNIAKSRTSAGKTQSTRCTGWTFELLFPHLMSLRFFFFSPTKQAALLTICFLGGKPISTGNGRVPCRVFSLVGINVSDRTCSFHFLWKRMRIP